MTLWSNDILNKVYDSISKAFKAKLGITINNAWNAITGKKTDDIVALDTVLYAQYDGELVPVQADNNGKLYAIVEGVTAELSFPTGDNALLKDKTFTDRAVAKEETLLKLVDPNPIVHTLIDDATFSATVTSDWIDLSAFKKGVNIILTQKTGTKTGTITLNTKIQVQDSNGNIMDYFTCTSVTTASPAAGTPPEDILFCTHDKIRFVSAITAGDTGNFANTTVEATIKPI